MVGKVDFLFTFFILIVAGFLFYSAYRLYRTRVMYNLMLVAIQLMALFIAIVSAKDGLYYDAFIVCLIVLFGVLFPLCVMIFDYSRLTRIVKEKTQTTISHLLFKNQSKEYQIRKEAQKQINVSQYLKPLAGDFSIDDIVDEIRVERSDTTRNILMQLEEAYKKRREADLVGAYSIYGIIEKIFNRSPSLYFNMGNIKHQCGDYEEAAKNYRRAIDCADNKEFADTFDLEKKGLMYFNLGNTYFMQKKYSKAIDAYKAAAEICPTNDDIFFNMSFCHAMDFQETGNLDKAIDAFQKIIEDMPGNLFALYNLGKCMFQMRSVNQAIECYQKVVDADPTFYECWYNLATAFDDMGNAAEAIRAYYTAIEIKPDFIPAYNDLGVQLSTVGRNGEALKVLRNASKIKPDDYELKYNIGVVLYESRKYEEALIELLPVVEHRPNDDILLYTIALVYLNLNRDIEALQYLAYAIKKNPEIKEQAKKDEKFKLLLYSNDAFRSIVQ